MILAGVNLLRCAAYARAIVAHHDKQVLRDKAQVFVFPGDFDVRESLAV